jgi:hypothetical protein
MQLIPILGPLSWIEMRLLFAALLSLKSGHLFWDMLSAACRIGLCAIPCLEVALLGPSALLQSAFDALSCVCLPRDEEQRLVRPEAAVSLFHLLNSVHRASVLGIAWRLIGAGGFGPVLDRLALLDLVHGWSAALMLEVVASARVFDVVWADLDLLSRSASSVVALSKALQSLPCSRFCPWRCSR